MTITVPRFDDFRGMVHFRDILRKTSRAELDFSSVGFAYPDGMVLLARIISDRISEGAELAAINFESASYPRNMGFFEACGLGISPEGFAPGNANYFPLKRCSSAELIETAEKRGQVPGQVANSMAAQLATIMIRGKDEQTQETITYSLREIIRNIAEHSASEDIFVSGQYYPNKGTVEIALMDRGIGIRQGLSNNPHLALGNDYEAILKSLVPGISGRSFHGMPDERRTEWSNSGYGLFMTSQICRMGGRFNIGSGDTLVSITKSEKTAIDFGFEGTFIGMELLVKNLGKLYPLLHRLRGRGERVARIVKVKADVEASYASSFVMEENGQ